MLQNRLRGRDTSMMSSIYGTYAKIEIQNFIELANNYHATIKFTAEISDIEITFLDKFVYKGERFCFFRKTKFEENITLFKQRLRNRGYPDNLMDKTLSEVNFSERLSTLQNKQKSAKRFCRLLRNIAHLCLTLTPF